MKLLKLTPSQRVQGRWLLHLEDGSLLRVGEGEVVSFGLYSGMELPAETLEALASAAALAALREKALNALPGVTASVDLGAGTALVTGEASDEAITAAVTDAGYTVVSIS